jgi:hypothetical protein
MTGARFLECLDILGWSLRHLARLLHCDTNLPMRWGRGAATVPPSIAQWLEALCHAHKMLPTPEDWRHRS